MLYNCYMINMIKIATAECFTHGKIGRELHALAQNYNGKIGRKYIKNSQCTDFDYSQLSVTCSLFIPTIEAVKKILNVKNPPEPNTLIKGIKVYDEKGDLKVSKIMAEAVKKLTDCDIAIGTTAGVGRGGITIISDEYEIITTTNVSGRSSPWGLPGFTPAPSSRSRRAATTSVPTASSLSCGVGR